jgi:dienelactone hydrolase
MEDVKHMTVKEETIEDAVKAAEWLKSDPRIDSNRVYIIGHSLGGMLTSRIDAEGGDFAGLIMLAGSPRTLWEIIYDQNIAALKGMKLDEATQKQQEELVREQLEKAKQLKEMTKEQALEESIFGVPAYYFKEMDEFDIESYLLGIEKPIFILQGEDDFQVYFAKDFALWQDMLQNRPNTAFKSYPGLNHFFVQYSGLGKGTIGEYKKPGIVSGEVLEDLAEWILKQ